MNDQIFLHCLDRWTMCLSGHLSFYLKLLNCVIIKIFQVTHFFFLFVVNFVIYWNETAMGLHVFPIPIPTPTSLSTRSP